jgi:drug/metabolite transporter (DMT)-like permease
MTTHHLGEIVALGTAICWTFTAIAFQEATRRVGSLSVNLIRLLMALVLYSIFSYFIRGYFFPADASAHNWIWMSLSGVVGFVLGDYFLFKSYEYISARISMLMMALAPPIAAFISLFALGETMSWKAIAAMMVTLAGIALVVLERKKGDEADDTRPKGVQFSFPVKGLILAFGGALGQAGGLVLSKYGMGDYNVFAATQIRVIAGSIGFLILITIIKRWPRVKAAVLNKKAMGFMTIGAVFGPFIGVYFSLLSIKFTSVGIASTLMSITPVLIIVPAIVIYKEKMNIKEIVGAVVTVLGVALFFI